MISNNFLSPKTIKAKILNYMDYKYSIYSIPHFGGFRRNLLFELGKNYRCVLEELIGNA